MTCSKPNKSSYFDGIFHKLVFFVFSFKEFTTVACKVVAVDNLGMLPCDYCVSTRTYSYRKGKFGKLSKCKMQILVHFSQTNLWKTFMNMQRLGLSPAWICAYIFHFLQISNFGACFIVSFCALFVHCHSQRSMSQRDDVAFLFSRVLKSMLNMTTRL